jgi:arylformamidase
MTPLTGGAAMKIYDISQEVFGCAVYPGDPSPERFEMLKISDGAVCNLTAFKMCAHNGTHVDAPHHFIDEGKTLEQVDMKRFIGYAYVASHEGDMTAEDAKEIVRRAKEAASASRNTDCDCFNRILVKGNSTVTEEAAKVFADSNILLYGNESQTVGPLDAPMAVHLIMLGAEIVLLEGIRLGEVCDGVYFLNAAPLNLGGADGAPCRAVLLSF